MTRLGYNLTIKIWRIVNVGDDVIGGATIREELAYEDIPARIEPNQPSTLLLDQGLEVDESFTMTIKPVNIRERDEVEVTWPPVHRFYGKRLRVTGVRSTSMNDYDSRTFYKITLRRKDYAYSK